MLSPNPGSNCKTAARELINECTDIALSEYLLERGGVAVVPGSAFGSEGYIRLSFATSMDNLEKALDRLRGRFPKEHSTE